jgi:predicted house-cleaning noncanonical NTP pyrophosphatase (MazG superfamily)
MEKYTKLVRDKIPEVLTKKGVPYEMRTVEGNEYRDALIKKLAEECAELAEAGAIEEFADVLEVVHALKALPQFADVEEVRRQKREERGGFEKGIILTGEK